MRPWHPSDRFFFLLYLAWIAVGLAAAPFHVTEATPGQWLFLPGWVRAFVGFCIAWGDPLLLLLAAENTRRIVNNIWGRRAARRWLVALLVIPFGLEVIGVVTGFPFGRYAYTENLGPRLDFLPFLGLVPVTIPLAWYVLISNALILWRSFLAGFIPVIEAAIVAGLVTALDWFMEPLASKIKVYWIWGGDGLPHWRNYVAWWVISFILILLFAKTPAHQDRSEPRPFLILGTIVLFFGVTRWTYGI
ncbi:Protein of unknown function [Verrucomicrobium sp. GAS474]|uniref:carotenoid biosynthesis protein n=1 Tax=Verrucomicrobium sp. GAS474 TaxID=1882831 RepID=UPI00087C2F0E|nr:carotenoid biosynthesis protein [Verrucomicrobium sp. GAS474]SDU01175.1 Protein of unknown function [Verrucomicrobium sp. GAS474]